MQDPDSFKRVGLVELECYHLCGQAWCKITIHASNSNQFKQHQAGALRDEGVQLQ